MPEVCFNGPAGRIEGSYTSSTSSTAPVALILHHHPFYGGTMKNEVVYTLHQAFVANGFTVLRINFRGIGKSEGQFDNGVGELTDAATALDWLQAQNQDALQYWVAGFSFGAWIGMQLIMRRPEINSFIAVSPPVHKYDFSFLSPCPIPGMIVHGDNDSIVPEETTMEFVNRLTKQKQSRIQYQAIQGGDHFFRTRLPELEECVSGYVKSNLNLGAPRYISKKHAKAQKLLLIG